MGKNNTGSDDYAKPFLGGVESGWSTGTNADQEMDGSKQVTKRQSVSAGRVVKEPAMRGTKERD